MEDGKGPLLPQFETLLPTLIFVITKVTNHLARSQAVRCKGDSNLY